MLNTYSSYQLIARNVDKALDRVEKQPTVARETEYYLANISKVKSAKEFMANDRLFRYAMKAHGLSDMTYAKAFMRKVLDEGIDTSDTFANKLSDTRYRDFANTFNFKRFNETTTVFTATRQGTVDKYLRQTLEENAGSDNEGVRLALYFERKAKTIDSFYDVLADTALSKVVRTALGLPDSFASANLEKQVALFESKLDLADFQDATKLGKFLKRFTSLWEVNNATSTASASVATLFSQGAAYGVSPNLMLTLQSMKR